MKVRVYYCIFGNFCSFKIYEVSESDIEFLKTKVYNDIKHEDFDWPLTIDDVKITNVIKL